MTRALALLLALAACNGPNTEDSDAPETGETGETADTGDTDTATNRVACTNFDEPGSGTANALPALLSETGCVDPKDPWTVVTDVLPYDINVPFWSDNAIKTRFVSVPEGGKITVYEDGDLDFPAGSTLLKFFTLGGKKIETRLYIKHSNGTWAGYSYEWNEAETEATLLDGGKDRVVGEQTWSYPSRSDCSFCHAAAATSTLGPEIGQLNKDYTYTDGTMNQVEKWAALGWFEEDPGDPSALDVYPDPWDTSLNLDDRARSYLHVNCSSCHRPGGASHLPMDWRIGSPLDGETCDAVPNNPGTITDARILAPGEPARSIMYIRPNDLNWRMPPTGSNVIHAEGVDLIGQWITSITSCPTSN